MQCDLLVTHFYLQPTCTAPIVNLYSFSGSFILPGASLAYCPPLTCSVSGREERPLFDNVLCPLAFCHYSGRVSAERHSSSLLLFVLMSRCLKLCPVFFIYFTVASLWVTGSPTCCRLLCRLHGCSVPEATHPLRYSLLCRGFAPHPFACMESRNLSLFPLY